MTCEHFCAQSSPPPNPIQQATAFTKSIANAIGRETSPRLVDRCGYDPAAELEMSIVGPQDVKFVYESHNRNVWFGGSDFAHARSIKIPASGTKTLTLIFG